MSEAQQVREWARSTGRQVSARGQIPEDLRREFEASVAEGSPGAWDEGFGPDDFTDPPEVDIPEMPREAPRTGPRTFTAVPADDETTDAPQPRVVDSEPSHARRRRERGGRTRQAREPKAAPTRMTAGLKKDIAAKIEFGLMIPATIWQARDPLCGGVFREQIPDVTEAFVDIVADSPDLIAFFAGPGGGFMKALKLGAALMPVGQVMMAHHVYHTAEVIPADPNQPQYAASDYAA
jgi:hypothetical protein